MSKFISQKNSIINNNIESNKKKKYDFKTRLNEEDRNILNEIFLFSNKNFKIKAFNMLLGFKEKNNIREQVNLRVYDCPRLHQLQMVLSLLHHH